MAMKSTRTWITVAALGAIVAMGLTSPPAVAARGVRIKVDLSASGVDPDASGKLQAQISRPKSGVRAKLNLTVRRLQSSRPYAVLFNGVPIGNFTTTAAGNGRARFDSQPRRTDQLLGADPRGMQVEIRSESGDSVLETHVPDDSVDPTHVRCCIPHSGDEGDETEAPECEDRTPEECMAAGGNDLGAGSCLPNPCEGTTPPPAEEHVVCCTPEDDNGAECELRSTASCSEHHGINLGTGTCDPNPCTSSTPPSSESVRCCLPDDSGAECEHRTPELCVAQGGKDIGPGTCSENACGTTPPPSGDTIRCCLPHDGGDEQAECETRTAAECTSQGGADMGAGSCEPNPCG